MHGLKKLELALTAKQMLVERSVAPASALATSDFYIIAGLVSDQALVTELLTSMKVSLPHGKEALLIRKTCFRGKPALLLCGADDVGLMYAALDIAKRISWSRDSSNPFQYMNNVTEKPDVQERAVSTGTFQRRYFEERLHDTGYWESYFDMMAENRLNQFLLIFGYKNNQYRTPNFTAPVYPNFFDLEAYPYVKLAGITAQRQEKNCAALKKVMALAHARGIEFGVGLWDQIERDGRYLAMVEDDREMPDDLPDNIIWGLSKQNLIPYTKDAMRHFFQTFPEIDLVQFRMHWEAGITGDVALRFWKEIFGILREECPTIKIEARAKDVPDETLYDGVDTGMDFRVATKHWMEQMGMPFHPTHINKDNQLDRRHGYADLLRYPKRYGFKWRVWNGGTTRVLQWGDPDWVKLFVEGSHLYNAVGFELNEPLYFKMNGSPHDAEVTSLLNPEFQYYTYEFERYWHFYQLVGRLGYNPQTPAGLWAMEFSRRFGEETGQHLMRALHQASKVLPRIVSASYLYPRFSSPQGWPELQRMEDLPHFAIKSKPSDIQQFASPMEEAELILSGGHSPRRLPSQTSDWFQETSARILDHVDRAEQSRDNEGGREYLSTITDLKMLAYLSRYHSQRLLAAVRYALYEKTGDLVSFDKAIQLESDAVAAYGRMVDAAGNVYAAKLDFGSNPQLFPGHWKDEHQRLREELEELRPTRGSGTSPVLAHVPVRRCLLGEPITISATVSESNIKTLRIKCATEGEIFNTVRMEKVEDGIWSGNIPNPGTEGSIKYYLESVDSSEKTECVPENGATSPYLIIVSNDRVPPVADLEYVTSATLNSDVNVSARVTDPSGVQRVVLRYRRVSQFEDYQSEPMVYDVATKRYDAAIPAEFLQGQYDIMYFIEVMDTKGNGRMVPDMEVETPYVIVHVDRNES